MELYIYDFFDPNTNNYTEGADPTKSPFLWSDSPVVDYTIESDIVSSQKYVFTLEKDFLFARDYIRGLVQNLSIDSVIGTENDPSVLTPSIGDKYLIGSNPVGIWAGKEGKIAIWGGSDWSYYSTVDDGFNMCTDAQKDVCVLDSIGSITQRKDYIGSQVIEIDARYRQAVNGSLILRYSVMDALMREQLPDNYYEVMADAGVSNYIANLLNKELNIIGTQAGDNAVGVSDYIDTILRMKPWNPIDYTMGGLCDELLNIIVDGIY